ncbi:hypothetical protein RFI_22452 [Reticulomyxa filosa]|uniref:Uncharacterized protein n=1 Tax=Reticulomyxa filosa TaxID=46433 RepID=X6MM67_RETFI|nr:hypothetical protein RFI_22452 [Reticulomyxa filosa]|eukprot:ETO14919.1 hypothetical protein RFI_22452 [Reticulomyxa filosa]
MGRCIQKSIKILHGHSDIVNDAQFSLDGSMIVSCSNDKTIRVWDVHSARQFMQFNGHSDHIITAQFSPHAYSIASCSKDRTIRLWDVQSGEKLKNIVEYPHGITDVQFSPDGEQLLTTFADNKIISWLAKSGAIAKELILKESGSRVIKTHFCSDGVRVVYCTPNKGVQVRSVISNQDITLEAHPPIITLANFSSDGQTVLTCSDDCAIRIWDAKFGIEIQKLEGHHHLVTGIELSPDGNIIAAYLNGIIRLWRSL